MHTEIGKNKLTAVVKSRFALPVLLAVLTVIAFSPVLTAEFVIIDDPDYVTDNPTVKAGLTYKAIVWAFTSFHASNWHPLTWLSHMLDVQLYGLNPAGHHLSSLLLHIVNVLLLGCLLQRLTGARWRSWLVAAFFALHPLRVESVVWVAERKDLLCAFFWLLTIWFYRKYAERPTVMTWLAVLLAFLGGLLAKPMVVTLPFVLLLLDYWPLGRTQWHKGEHVRPMAPGRLFLEKVPLLLGSLAVSIITFKAQLPGMNIYPLQLRLANAFCSYWAYVQKSFWPSGLAVFYPFRTVASWWQAALAAAVLLAITIACVLVRRRQPYLIVGWLWFVGALVPVIGLIQTGEQAMADRYIYLPGIGLLIMLVWGCGAIVERFNLPTKGVTVGIGVILMVLGGITFRQTGFWHDSETLFLHTLAVTQRNYLAHYNLGLALLLKGETAEARQQLTEAVRIRPAYGPAWTNLGVLLGMEGEYAGAVNALQQALTLNPLDANAHYNMALAWLALGKIEKAEQEYGVLRNLSPEFAEKLRERLR